MRRRKWPLHATPRSSLKHSVTTGLKRCCFAKWKPEIDGNKNWYISLITEPYFMPVWVSYELCLVRKTPVERGTRIRNAFGQYISWDTVIQTNRLHYWTQVFLKLRTPVDDNSAIESVRRFCGGVVNCWKCECPSAVVEVGWYNNFTSVTPKTPEQWTHVCHQFYHLHLTSRRKPTPCI